MKTRFSLLACVTLLAACGSPGTPSSVPAAPFSSANVAEAHKKPRHLNWTLFADQSYPEVQIAKVPLREKSKITNIGGNSDFALSASGDLYFANCGTNPSIFVYPTSKKKFSLALAPSLDYTNAAITGAGCAWGIAIQHAD